MRLEIIVDRTQHEGREFVAWLKNQGHDAALETAGRRSSEKSIILNSQHETETDNQILSDLWSQYCREGQHYV
jgi:hypothetical protein